MKKRRTRSDREMFYMLDGGSTAHVAGQDFDFRAIAEHMESFCRSLEARRQGGRTSHCIVWVLVFWGSLGHSVFMKGNQSGFGNVKVCSADSPPSDEPSGVLEKRTCHCSREIFGEQSEISICVFVRAFWKSRIRSMMRSLGTRISSGIYTPKTHPKSRHT